MKLKGFTMIEVIIVIVIIGIISAASVLGINKAVQNSKVDKSAAMVRSIVSDLDLYLTERGALDDDGSTIAQDFINDFNTNYASMTFDVSSLDVGLHSFTVKASTAVDAWGNNIVLYYGWDNRMFIVASAGPNAVFDFLTEKDPNKVDDVFAAAILK